MKKFTIVFIIVVAILAGYFYLFKPQMTFEEVRASDKPEEVKAVFVNVTGDPLCAKLYVLDHMDNDKPVASNEPLFLALPNGMPSPEDSNLAYTDNIFILKGYRYQFEERNKLTKNTQTSASHRFDVISWEIVPPYTKWKSGSSSGNDMVETEKATEPVSHQFSNQDNSPNLFTKGNYVDCLR